MQKEFKPLVQDDLLKSSTGLLLVIEDESGVSSHVIEELTQQGLNAALVPGNILDNPSEIDREVSRLQDRERISGIIHLSGLTEMPMPDSIELWHYWGKVQLKSLFHLLQICAEDLRHSQGFVLSASCLGGSFGRDTEMNNGLPFAGGSSGMLKTMMLEWENVRAKVIDFDADSLPSVIAKRIVDEFNSQDTDVEIGYSNDRRIVFNPIEQPITPTAKNPVKPEQDWVILCLGGARGITTEIVAELLVPGITLVILGRSSLEFQEIPEVKNVEDLSKLRKILIQQALHQRKKATPSQIERQISQIKKHRAINKNLNHFKDCGVKVEYHSIDVQDVDGLGALIGDLYKRYGRIDAVVQGAGIVQDKLIVDKVPISFDLVFNTKVESTYALCKHLRSETLKLVVLFASVAGRTGNRGQVDYAAANEVLNRFAWWMRANWSDTRILSVNWGPWAASGMASDAINQQFEKRGVMPISPEAGRKFFAEELRYGSFDDVELITGFYHGMKSQNESTVKTISASDQLPFALGQPEVQKKGGVFLDHQISLETHPYIKDHCLNDIPVLPAACALELMAQFIQTAWPEWVVTEVQGLKVLGGIRLQESSSKTVRLKANTSTHTDAGILQVKAEITKVDETKVFYRGTFILRNREHNLAESDVDTLEFSKSSNTEPLSFQSLSQKYCFHGPLFKLVKRLERLSEDNDIQVEIQPSDPQVWLNTSSSDDGGNWIFNPGLVDSSLQLVLIWLGVNYDIGALPSKFGRIIRSGKLLSDMVLELNIRITHHTTNKIIFDAIFLDETNQPRLILEAIESTCSKFLKRFTSNV